jgi:hypothetical protein
VEWTADQLAILKNADIGNRAKSRIEKMDALADAIQRGDITDHQVEILRNSGVLRVQDSRKRLRQELGVSGTLRAQGKEAHHDLPVISSEPDLELEFLKRGIDPNKAENGRIVDIEKHKLIHGKGTTGWGNHGDPYIYQWDRFFNDPAKPNPDAAAILQFRDELRTLTSPPFSNADDLTWPYAKP